MMPRSSILNSPVTNWRDSVTSDLRLHLVHKFLQALVPGVQKSALNDPALQYAVEDARQIENECYENANSRAEYYHLLAQKIYKTQLDAEIRREQNRHNKSFEEITNKFKNL